MPSLVRLFAVVSIVGISAPAFACYTGTSRGVGIQLGSVFFGFSKHRHAPCPAVVVPVVPQPLPPVSYYTQPQPVVVAAPVVYSPPPMVYAAPAPVAVAAAPAVRATVARPADDRPGFLALKYMPGVSSNISGAGADMNLSTPAFAHSPGLELRFTRWFSLRSDLEFRREGRTWDVLGVKLSLLPNSPVKPYASVSFSGNENYSNPGRYSFGFAGAAGLDVMLGKHFFLEAEARYRMTPGACCSEVPALTGLVGAGVAFF